MYFIIILALVFFVIFYLQKEKAEAQRKWEIQRAFHIFQTNQEIFLNLPPDQQQAFLDGLDEFTIRYFIKMIETQNCRPTSNLEIQLMNDFVKWAESKGISSVSPVEWKFTYNYVLQSPIKKRSAV